MAQPLPVDFISEDWNSHANDDALPACLTRAEAKCNATLLELGTDGSSAILVIVRTSASVFAQDRTGKWEWAGSLGNTFCPDVADALSAGKIQLVTPRFKDIEVNGIKLPVTARCR